MPSARHPLDRDRVVAEAMALADEAGLAALSMRALAGRLGVEAMSLYHHVPGKEALLDAMVDRCSARCTCRSSAATGAPSCGRGRSRDAPCCCATAGPSG